ncbi:hypothetical protein Acor_81670 [Acrocarpospora corrugata]|uniref:DUF929 domain-containing protein n=1 Tax=Acrocarpospora corrugata TaxID=35763 RepID=A0A5M3WIB4_9ACTN|nr:DUF929 family protein [Acrocarpospora corrugata]GES06098.1 hypothetical protein Acor_81670 [Acrocarpospora corrugata]
MSGAKERRRRVEEMRQEQSRRRADAVRRRRMTMVGAPIAAVVLVLGVMVVIKLSGTGAPAEVPKAAAGSTVAKLTGVPAQTLIKAGPPPDGTRLLPVSGEPPLEQDGKPRILYLGAEYCPYCAAQRWPLIVALSRFGTFTGLQESRSSATDVFPNTATFTFRSASYASPYLAFTAVETQDAEGRPLQRLNDADAALVGKLNAPPYTPEESRGSIPFIDFGNRYLTTGASLSPQLFDGLDHAQIADRLADPADAIGKPVSGIANLMTAGICALTANQPADVCGDPVVKSLGEGLNGN